MRAWIAAGFVTSAALCAAAQNDTVRGCGEHGILLPDNTCECVDADRKQTNYWGPGGKESCDIRCGNDSLPLVLPYGLFMLYMFAGLALVCEEYFVPSLNILCERLKLPDDVAGATFMAAGASSPELFASLIGVLSGSAVGIGTVVGSELFNMLVIVGAVCLCTSGGLLLDWRPLAREVSFFLGSLILLIFVLSDDKVDLWQAFLLVSGYGVYVMTCAYYPQICCVLCPLQDKGDEGDEESSLGGTGGWEQKFLPGGTGESTEQANKGYDRVGSPNMVSVSGEMFGFEYGTWQPTYKMIGVGHGDTEFFGLDRIGQKSWLPFQILQVLHKNSNVGL